MKTYAKSNETIEVFKQRNPKYDLGELDFNWTPRCVKMMSVLNEDVHIDGNASGNTAYSFVAVSSFGRMDTINIFSDDVKSAESYARDYFVALHQDRLGRRNNPAKITLYRLLTDDEITNEAERLLEEEEDQRECCHELGLDYFESPAWQLVEFGAKNLHFSSIFGGF